VVCLTAAAGDGADDGASLVEYVLLIAFIALVCLAVISLLGSESSTNFSSVGSAIGP
jgi:pilus assembly protein Flp/PilA